MKLEPKILHFPVSETNTIRHTTFEKKKKKRSLIRGVAKLLLWLFTAFVVISGFVAIHTSLQIF